MTGQFELKLCQHLKQGFDPILLEAFVSSVWSSLRHDAQLDSRRRSTRAQWMASALAE